MAEHRAGERRQALHAHRHLRLVLSHAPPAPRPRRLGPDDLLPLDEFLRAREALRERLLAHKAPRRVALAPGVVLHFEDRLTVLWQVQEALRIERLFEAHAIAAELEAWNLLLPAGDDLRATLVIEAGPGQPHAPARLGGIERHVLARVAGFAPFVAEAGDAGPGAGGEAAVFFLRFAFPPAQVLALRAGATLGLAIDDDRLRVALTLPEPTRLALLADFD